MKDQNFAIRCIDKRNLESLFSWRDSQAVMCALPHFPVRKKSRDPRVAKCPFPPLYVHNNENEHNLLTVLFVSQKKVAIWSSEISKFYPSLHLQLPMNISAFACHDANFSEKKSYEFSSESTLCHIVSLASNSWKLAEFLVKSISSPGKGRK